MKHIAIYSDDSKPVENFHHLAPTGQAHVKQRLLAEPRVDSMQNWVAIFKEQLASEAGDLNVRRECALFVVQYDPARSNLYGSVQRRHYNNCVANPSPGSSSNVSSGTVKPQ